MALKQKQREDKKKLADAQSKASQKGPMGESSCIILLVYNIIVFLGVGGIKKSKK